MKAVRTLMALSLTAAGCIAGCGVGSYHIPDVPPVVMPEPEEDMFADLDMGGGGETTPAPSAEPEAKPAEPQPAAETPPAAPETEALPAEEAKPKGPAKKKK